MKIPDHNSPRQQQNGSATVIFTILLSIMMILVLAETRSLVQLHRDQLLLEKRQAQRIQHAAGPAPAVSLTTVEQK